MDFRKPLDGFAISITLVLCVVWALQQIVLKATGGDMSAVLQLGLRSGMSAALLWLFMRNRGERLEIAGAWRPGLAIGTLFGLEFMALGEALHHTTAAHAVVFLYTAPIFAALGMHWKLESERLSAAQWIGILMAFAGIAVAFLDREAGGGEIAPGSVLWGDFLALLAGAGWGATTAVVRTTRLTQLPASQPLMYQLLGGFVIITGWAVVTGQTTFTLTAPLLASLAFQAVLVSFVSYLIWYWLLRHYLASRLGVLSFATPLFGVVLGAWLLDEPIEPGFIKGSCLVLAGITLVSGYGWFRQLTAAITRSP